jgi:uncharacterized protein (DUF1778 family)
MEKTERIALRATARERELLYEASRIQESTLSEFVLGAATAEAENVLADRTRFVLPPAEWDRFVEQLDRTPVDKPRLRRLLKGPREGEK